MSNFITYRNTTSGIPTPIAPVAEDLISAPASQALYKANIFVLWNAHRRTQQSDEKKLRDACVFKVKFTFAHLLS